MEDYLVAKEFLNYLKIRVPPKAPEGKIKTFLIKLIHDEIGYKKYLEEYHVKYLNEIVDLARTKSYHADKLLFKYYVIKSGNYWRLLNGGYINYIAQIYKSLRLRNTHCFNCYKNLNSLTGDECSACNWIRCNCGSCGCNYVKNR